MRGILAEFWRGREAPNSLMCGIAFKQGGNQWGRDLRPRELFQGAAVFCYDEVSRGPEVHTCRTRRGRNRPWALC